ncbi:MAG: hypothetical protein KJ904_14115 [Alphaproteobacteria bacterium]|nr:hypothetical protein [Alphaproteobacteria bacterium]MBU0796541.1 hypothetical protein [Alphaproteobacteria bacterium]MBU0888289.1 hypothetical protein [Alphaproteobacteria bacterium]MBU1811490.1 hypothetical protein [Alphaproteobacteria bacterium]MBU2089422.1 hypothetical protein [Alphaproteobacteria bacterium]
MPKPRPAPPASRTAYRILAVGSVLWIVGVSILWFVTWPPATQVYDAAYYAGQRDCRQRYAGAAERVERCINLFNLQYLRDRNGHAITGGLVALFPPGLGWAIIAIRRRMR